jgi:formylglycine-generating enzyme required for sulfatase activity
MIDDNLLRQTAALQANLKMLESQQDALSDFQDMQALRLYKARLVDYIEAHSNAGHLPPDPFQVIQQRLVAVSEFFTAADQECERLNNWRADWLKSVPAVDLADLQSATTELTGRVAEVPHIQDRLRQRLSPLDWDTSTTTVDLHRELLACAQCVSGLKLPPIPERRRGLYQFTHGEGTLAKKTAAHFTAMGLRIEKLIALHAGHVKALAVTDHHLSNDSFRSAEKSFKNLGSDRFSDVDYSLVELRLRKAMGVLAQFTSLDLSLNQLLEKSEYKAVTAELSRLHRLIEKPDSELGREALVLFQKMDSRFVAARFVAAQKAHKKRMVTRVAFISLYIAGLGAFSLYWVKENAKAEEARVIAPAKAEEARVIAPAKAEEARVIAPAKAEIARVIALAKAEEARVIALAKAEAAYEKFKKGNRAGEEKSLEIVPGIAMIFCWCPPGDFTIGSPKSEEYRSSDEKQAKVTLTQGFWMAKTEVTQAHWQALMGSNPSEFKGLNLPVENVSWIDTQKFLMKVNAIVGNSDGGEMALPTEAQWEYAARAGETGPYSGGTVKEVAWYDNNSGSGTHEVGTKRPNAWGLHDMHGNVWEWCADWYEDELDGGVDPQGAASDTNRVIRGGSWYNGAIICRVANRMGISPYSTHNNYGFRVARSSVP